MVLTTLYFFCKIALIHHQYYAFSLCGHSGSKIDFRLYAYNMASTYERSHLTPMTTTSLKFFALILMFIDHVGEFIPGTPLVLRMIGRISAPLFLFCAAWGFHYTHNRKIYLLRLYICSALMGVMDFTLNTYVGVPYHTCTNNIFSSLFCIFLFIYFWDLSTTREKKIASVLGYIFLNITGTAISIILVLTFNIPFFGQIISGIIPTFLTCEGTIFTVAMGIILYFCKENQKRLVIGYGGYCVVYLLQTIFLNTTLFTASPTPWTVLLFSNSIQWMQVAALPFMLIYNKERGIPVKYFFYVFYFIHIALLFGLGNTIFLVK